MNNPAARNVNFDQLVNAYLEQTRALVQGGADILMVETIFADYAKLLSSSPRYQQVLATGQDAGAFAAGLQRAGYATDPRYADKLIAMIDKYQLEALDLPLKLSPEAA